MGLESVEVKFFTREFFWASSTSFMTSSALFVPFTPIYDHLLHTIIYYFPSYFAHFPKFQNIADFFLYFFKDKSSESLN